MHIDTSTRFAILELDRVRILYRGAQLIMVVNHRILKTEQEQEYQNMEKYR